MTPRVAGAAGVCVGWTGECASVGSGPPCCIRLGGSITGEHGVGVEKIAYMKDMFTKDNIECMERVRCAIDPGKLANRGKMLPEGEPPALKFHGPHPLEKEGRISRE